MLGPVFFYEMVRTGRRRRYFVLRGVYSILLASLVLNFFGLAYQSLNFDSGLGVREAARVASSYFLVVSWTQFIVLCLLTPAYVAGAIAQEKESKIIEFILATDLRSREIVLGKLFARLANLVILMLVGLPILSLVQFMGGVDPTLVLATTAATIACVASLAALSIFNSVLSRRARDAIAMTYLCAVAYLLLSGLSMLLLNPAILNTLKNPAWLTAGVEIFNAGNPFSVLAGMGTRFATGATFDDLVLIYLRDFLVFHCVLFTLCCIGAVAWMRRIALRQAQGTIPRKWFKGRVRNHPRVGNFPLLWKEIFVESGLKLSVLGRVVFFLLIAGAVFVLWNVIQESRSSSQLADAIRFWAQVTGMLTGCLLLLAVASRAATSVTQERERQTMDALLTCPVSAGSIIYAKWIGAILAARWGLFFLVVIYLVGILAGSVYWVTLPLELLAWFIYAGVVALIGLWASIVCKSGLWSTVFAYGGTALAGVGHWLLLFCCLSPLFFAAGPRSGAEELLKLQAGFTPPVAMIISFCIPVDRWGTSPGDGEMLGYGLVGLMGWGVIAFFLWVGVRNSFDLKCGRAQFRIGSITSRAPGGASAPKQHG